MDTLVLACTHYPLIESLIQEVATDFWGHPVCLVDSASTMAWAAQDHLQKLGLLNNAQPGPLEKNTGLAYLLYYRRGSRC